MKKRFDVRGDEESADLHRKSESADLHRKSEEAVQQSQTEVTPPPLKGTTRKSPHKLEKPPHKIKEQIMKLLGKDVQGNTGDKRKIMLPGQAAEGSSDTAHVSEPAYRNGKNSNVVEVVSLEHRVGGSSSKKNDVVEVIKVDEERNRIHKDETIKV